MLKEDLADHAKITARYAVNGISYEHVESAGYFRKDGKINVYYLLSDPAHATYKNPEWIWYAEAVGKFLGVGLWCIFVYFGLWLQEKFRSNAQQKKIGA